MNNVVSLAEWKKSKQDEEIKKLEAELADLIGELDIVPEPYFVAPPAYHNISEYGGGGYGMLTKFNPTVEDCMLDLQFISCILNSLGKGKASDTIDIVIKELKE